MGVALVVGVLAMGLMAAASASAAKLTLSAGGATLAPGDILYGESPVGDFSLSTFRELGCEFFRPAGLGAKVVTNSKDTDALEGGLSVEVEACRSNAGWAELELFSGDGLKLRSNGYATTGGASLFIEFENSGITCDLSTSHLTGGNTATTNRQKLEIELGGTLKLKFHGAGSEERKEKRKACPKEASFGISFPTVEGENGELIEEQT